ncbi:MAG TPA: TMEM175 family protein [Longimicrobium sp.]|jgi:hypothetical protein|uniref:TMEM175 family protein n=1 Tax=Longimicrobium sp. TaxID=2029185 RepID=UPI002ED84A7F
MIRSLIMQTHSAGKDGFRLRGTDVSRLEALSDAVFGFAITLLVVSLEVPQTATELFNVMRGFVAFAACFALLFLVWWHQHRFFRRYGLNDGVTTVLNGVLLFVVLFFVYPLKFVFGLVVAMATGERPWLIQPGGGDVPVLQNGQWPMLMVVFSAGYIAVFAVFALLHLHALRCRETLELTEVEVFDTVGNVRESALNVSVGVLSILLALFGGMLGPMLAGCAYWLIGPVMWINGMVAGRARNRLVSRLAADGRLALG